LFRFYQDESIPLLWAAQRLWESHTWTDYLDGLFLFLPVDIIPDFLGFLDVRMIFLFVVGYMQGKERSRRFFWIGKNSIRVRLVVCK